MSPSRRSRGSRTTPSVGLQEGSLGRRNNIAQWNACFNELLKYKAEHGDCDFPTRQGKLGTWVCTQRSAYWADSLAQDRIDRLNSIGFKWSLGQTGPTVPWKSRFHELVQYKAMHGECDVPVKQGRLGLWVHRQRTNYRKNKLSQDRVDCLNDIGFDWTPLREVQGREKLQCHGRLDSVNSFNTRQSTATATYQ